MKEKEKVARPEGFEPPTLCFEGRCSIQLSYGRVLVYSTEFALFVPLIRVSTPREILEHVRNALLQRGNCFGKIVISIKL